jgi:hypothetical protein
MSELPLLYSDYDSSVTKRVVSGYPGDTTPSTLRVLAGCSSVETMSQCLCLGDVLKRAANLHGAEVCSDLSVCSEAFA